MKRIDVLTELFENYIKDTPSEIEVVNRAIFLCYLTKTVMRVINIEKGAVYVNSRMLKHLYDKKPAEEFHFILKYTHKIVKYPQHIYRNKDEKRGNFCFVKNIKGADYICSIEFADEKIFIATAFRLRKPNYIKNYELLWNWEDDNSPS